MVKSQREQSPFESSINVFSFQTKHITHVVLGKQLCKLSSTSACLLLSFFAERNRMVALAQQD
jgi:hypothetical protein